MNLDIVSKLKEHYNDLPKLIFHRSVERAKDEVELFDILDSYPKSLPLTWNAKEKRWVVSPLIKPPGNNFLLEK